MHRNCSPTLPGQGEASNPSTRDPHSPLLDCGEDRGKARRAIFTFEKPQTSDVGHRSQIAGSSGSPVGARPDVNPDLSFVSAASTGGGQIRGHRAQEGGRTALRPGVPPPHHHPSSADQSCCCWVHSTPCT